jgi:hypothetical protein
MARGCSESDMDESIAERVNQMTKIIMASTADAWLVHLPGSTRRHEIFTVEQLAQDSANLDDLATSLQDPEDDCPAGCVDPFLSEGLFTGITGMSLDSKPGIFLSFVYRELEKLASAKDSIRIPVLIQTRAQGELRLVSETRKRMHSPSVDRKGRVDAVTAKQR